MADDIIAGVLLVSLIIGAWRGLTREVFGLAAWIAAFWLAWRFGTEASTHMTAYVADQKLRHALGYAAVFIIVLVLAEAIAAILSKLVRSSPLASTDRLLGAAAGLVRGVLLVSVALMLVIMNGGDHSRWWRESVLTPRLAPVAQALRRVVPPSWLKPLEKPTTSLLVNPLKSEH